MRAYMPTPCELRPLVAARLKLRAVFLALTALAGAAAAAASGPVAGTVTR